MSDINIDICNEQDSVIIDPAQIENTILHVLGHHRIEYGTISVAFVGDDTISGMKGTYFGQTVATDVISFDLRDDSDGALECEIVVNGDRALREARSRNIAPAAELNLYVLHGLLHQLGYDDQSDEAYAEMHLTEDRLLCELGFGYVFDKTGSIESG